MINREVEWVEEDGNEPQNGLPWQLTGMLTISLIVAATGLYGYVSDDAEASSGTAKDTTGSVLPISCLPPGFASRAADRAYEGLKYLPGELDSMPVHQEGRANFYGGGEPLNLHTSSGDVFDPEAMAAASWFYPLETSVKVTDLGSGKAIVVHINDRGPDRVSHPDVIIDLTQGAMRALDPVAGSLRVTVAPICP